MLADLDPDWALHALDDARRTATGIPRALLVTALRNLVLLFARIGVDRAAAELAASLVHHAATHPSYGQEATGFAPHSLPRPPGLDATCPHMRPLVRSRSLDQAATETLAAILSASTS